MFKIIDPKMVVYTYSVMFTISGQLLQICKYFTCVSSPAGYYLHAQS